jgi:hypothetical protein
MVYPKKLYIHLAFLRGWLILKNKSEDIGENQEILWKLIDPLDGQSEL